MDSTLSELVAKLQAALGTNLKSVVLYGSAASGEFHRDHSDLNVLCVLERLDATHLERLNAAAEWWGRRGHPTPLVFTREELHRVADVFAIELLDIKASRRVLLGEDIFADLDVPTVLHRLQVERELHTNLIRLRQGYMAAPRKNSVLYLLLSASLSTFIALFRHALIALGEQPPSSKRAVVDRLAGLLDFDPSGFHDVLDVREGKRPESQLDVSKTFGAYLTAISRATEEVDRRLAARR